MSNSIFLKFNYSFMNHKWNCQFYQKFIIILKMSFLLRRVSSLKFLITNQIPSTVNCSVFFHNEKLVLKSNFLLKIQVTIWFTLIINRQLMMIVTTLTGGTLIHCILFSLKVTFFFKLKKFFECKGYLYITII